MLFVHWPCTITMDYLHIIIFIARITLNSFALNLWFKPLNHLREVYRCHTNYGSFVLSCSAINGYPIKRCFWYVTKFAGPLQNCNCSAPVSREEATAIILYITYWAIYSLPRLKNRSIMRELSSFSFYRFNIQPHFRLSVNIFNAWCYWHHCSEVPPTVSLSLLRDWLLKNICWHFSLQHWSHVVDSGCAFIDNSECTFQNKMCPNVSNKTPSTSPLLIQFFRQCSF